MLPLSLLYSTYESWHSSFESVQNAGINTAHTMRKEGSWRAGIIPMLGLPYSLISFLERAIVYGHPA